MLRHKPGIKWLWLTLVILVLDRITKSWILDKLTLNEIMPVFPHFNLTLAYNKGAAFSFLSEASGWQGMFFAAISLLVTFIILVWLSRLKVQDRMLSMGLTLVMGGALGNLTDRLMYGHVIDFLQLYAGTWYWPSFNIADSAICVGAMFILLDSLTKRKT